LLAVLSLFQTACESDDTESSDKQTQQTGQEDPTQELREDERAYLNGLAGTYATLDDEELLEAGHNACGQIMINLMTGETWSQGEPITGKDISRATFSTSVEFDTESDIADSITQQAVYHICPQVIDDFNYDAMRS